jgi:hypothetical protein
LSPRVGLINLLAHRLQLEWPLNGLYSIQHLNIHERKLTIKHIPSDNTVTTDHYQTYPLWQLCKYWSVFTVLSEGVCLIVIFISWIFKILWIYPLFRHRITSSNLMRLWITVD